MEKINSVTKCVKHTLSIVIYLYPNPQKVKRCNFRFLLHERIEATILKYEDSQEGDAVFVLFQTLKQFLLKVYLMQMSF